MNRRFWALLAVALLAGVAFGELAVRWPRSRDLLGQLCGRGHLLALAGGEGIYADEISPNPASLRERIVAANLRALARSEPAGQNAVEREVQNLTAQFADENAFLREAEESGFDRASLHDAVASELGGLQWIERLMAPDLAVTAAECERFYQEHLVQFSQPARFHLRHIFLAAHRETPPDQVAAKQKSIEALSVALKRGENFAGLAAQVSEDEASRKQGGDLGWVATWRMPAEFMEAVSRLRAGETSAPLRSHLGFHIAQLLEVRAGRTLTFEEARPEIEALLAAQKRRAAVERAEQRLAAATWERLQR